MDNKTKIIIAASIGAVATVAAVAGAIIISHKVKKCEV